MKKLLTGILFIFLTVLIIALEWLASPKLNIFGIMPSLFIIFLSFAIIYTDTKTAIFIAIIGGLLIDFTLSKMVGITSLSAILASIMFSNFREIILENSEILYLFTVFCMTFMFELIRVLMDMGMFSYRIEPGILFYTLLIEAVITTIVFAIIYPIIKFFGEKTLPIYNKNNILTRYF